MATQNAGELSGPETKLWELLSLEYKYVPGDETELREEYDRVGLDGAKSQGWIQHWLLSVLYRGFTLPLQGCCSPAFGHILKAAVSTPLCI